MSGMIPDIHLYCDGYCAVCPYRLRCSVYEQQLEVFPTPASRDMANPEFWARYHEYLGSAALLMVIAGKHQNLDVDAMLAEVDGLADPASHELALAAGAYSRALPPVWQAIEELLPAKEVEWTRLQSLGEDSTDALADGKQIKEAIEVLRQFQNFLQPKLSRALAMLEQSGEEDALLNGTVKSALVVMEKCLAGWSVLWRFFPELHDVIIERIAMLTGLRSRSQELFPKAQAFIRPGFDSSFQLEEDI